MKRLIRINTKRIHWFESKQWLAKKDHITYTRATKVGYNEVNDLFKS